MPFESCSANRIEGRHVDHAVIVDAASSPPECDRDQVALVDQNSPQSLSAELHYMRGPGPKWTRSIRPQRVGRIGAQRVAQPPDDRLRRNPPSRRV